jgi:putative redox protein
VAGVEVELSWREGTRLEGRSGEVAVTLDWQGRAGPSPVQALAFALAGCMASDVVLILQKGRQPLQGLRARLSGERAPTDPHRLTAVRLDFEVRGDVPPEKVERAIALSRETYCSVWHSLRQDIDFRTSFAVVPAT